jgi:hypothetical protein
MLRQRNARTLSDQNAGRIDQEDAAVRLQCAKQLRRIVAEHAVEHAAVRRGLHEAGDFFAANRERLPVDDRLVELVTVSVLPFWTKLALPLTTLGASGRAKTTGKEADTLWRSGAGDRCLSFRFRFIGLFTVFRACDRTK